LRKYIVLFCTLIYIGISVWKLYYAYAPKVGPIGNGPNETKIWSEFTFSIIGSAAFIAMTINLFKKNNKN
jgi:hypothetical protein